MHGSSILTSFETWLNRGKFSSFVAGAFCLAFCSSVMAQSSQKEVAPSPLAQMTLRQKIGQLFIWTYPGTRFDAKVEAWLQEFQPGALIVFSRNIKSGHQIAKFNSELQKFASQKMRAPFFLMIDQEGGTVTRLKSSLPLPSALAIGKLDDPEFTRKYAAALGDTLKTHGFNVNLAPVLDISNPEKDTFIGSRSFGDDPDKVTSIGGAFSEGLSQRGLLPTAKHFPGHGGILQDSHHAIPRKMGSFEDLADQDYVPFEEFASSDFPTAIMMGHLVMPDVDPSGLPSTYSPKIIGEHLRGKLKFKGLILTDDLEMNGASSEQDIGSRAVKALLAGNDMLMFAGSPTHQRRAFAAVEAAVSSGKITEERLNESVQRILKAKKDLKIGEFKYDSKSASSAIATTDALTREVLKRNLKSALNETTSPLPSVTDKSRVLVASSDRRVYRSFKETFPGKVDFFGLSPKSVRKVEQAILQRRYDFVLYYVSGSQTARHLNRLSTTARRKILVINTNHPGKISAQTSFLGVVNIRTANPYCGTAIAEHLRGPELRGPASPKTKTAVRRRMARPRL